MAGATLNSVLRDVAGMYRETDGWEGASDHTRENKNDDGYEITENTNAR